MTGDEPTVQRDAGRDDLLAPELIEAAAEALYESQRQPEYTGTEYDWPNVDSGYDCDDEATTDPEWCRNSYRADAAVVLAVVVPLVREQIAAEAMAGLAEYRPTMSCCQSAEDHIIHRIVRPVARGED